MLLGACAKVLAERGMRRMFVDGIKGEGLQALGRCPVSSGCVGIRLMSGVGFKEWATYRDVWQRM